MRSQLSVMALYEFDNTLFDAFHLPEALEMDREIIECNVLVETAELETLFTNPVIFKKVLDNWSYKQVPIWDKLYKTTQLVYNPIWNVDGTTKETIEIERSGESANTETRENSSSTSSSTKDSRTGSNTDTETRDLHTTDNEDRDLERSENSTGNKDTTGQASHAVFAYNSGNESPESVDHTNGHESSALESSGTDSGSIDRTGTENGTVKNVGSNTNSGSSETNGTGSETGSTTNNGTESSTEKHTNTTIRQGNVGVTTTQSMIKEEREVDLFNIVDIIVNDFKNRFCLLVY